MNLIVAAYPKRKNEGILRRTSTSFPATGIGIAFGPLWKEPDLVPVGG